MVVESTVPIHYQLLLGSERVVVNDWLGKKLCLKWVDKIHCVKCTRLIPKSYQEGYCFPCVQKLAACDLCIVKPERCHFHLGTCREPQWGQAHCMIPHYVYLANASGIKVGITRTTQLPTRWIDQGAIAALLLFEVTTRRISGLVEVKIAEHISDKTNWRRMLSGEPETIDLMAYREKLHAELQESIDEINQQFGAIVVKALTDTSMHAFEYPVLQYPKKVNSLSFDKTPFIEGTLLGIKGQYLILDTGVLNIRKHSGYLIEMH